MASPLPPQMWMSASATEPPRSSKTIDTVVDVGRPSVLKTSSSTTSVTITATKMHIRLLKLKTSGRKMPWRAMSIMPLLMVAPQNTPHAAMKSIILNFKALEPMAEFRKLTASLLTPTTKSKMASRKMIRIIPK